MRRFLFDVNHINVWLGVLQVEVADSDFATAKKEGKRMEIAAG
jgi:hypothetical protein